MQYLFLAYQDEELWGGFSETEQALIEEACLAHEQEMRQSGYLVAVEDFRRSQTALTVQTINGQLAVRDSLTAETKQHLTHLFLINARDLNEAIQLISKMPQSRKGPIEIRPILTLHLSATADLRYRI